MRSDLFLFLLVLVQPSPMDLHDQVLDAVAEDEVHEGVFAKDEKAVADLVVTAIGLRGHACLNC